MRTDSRILANTIVRADIQVDEDLSVEGHVIGSLSGSATVFVAPGGILEADVHVKKLVVGGVVVGNISAVEAVEVSATGQVKGNIRTPALTLQTGGRIAGNVKTGVSVDAARSSRQRGRRLPNSTLRDSAHPGETKSPPQAASSNPRGVTMQGISSAHSITRSQLLEHASKQAQADAASSADEVASPDDDVRERVDEESLRASDAKSKPEVVEEDSVTPAADTAQRGDESHSKKPQNA